MIVVTDASAVLAALLPDERGEEILDTLRASNVSAPAIWHVEIANAILFALKRKRIDIDIAESMLAMIRKLDVELVAADFLEVERDIFPLARKHALTVYDASYVHLARSRGAILFTADKVMRKAARNEGVEVR